MLNKLSNSLKIFHKEWQGFVKSRRQKNFFNSLKPTAAAWKTTDLAEFEKLLLELSKDCDQVHLGWVNERWLATLHLKTKKLPMDIKIIKLMQRRPQSKDAVGLDHVDFLRPKNTKLDNILVKETGVKWTKEMNGRHCKWISIWFSNTEAKLRSDTVIDVCISEMNELLPQLTN